MEKCWRLYHGPQQGLTVNEKDGYEYLAKPIQFQIFSEQLRKFLSFVSRKKNNNNTHSFQRQPKLVAMQLLTIVALQSCIALAFAMPQSLEKRQTVGVYFCQDDNWQGICQHQTGPIGQCIEVSSSLQNQISCIGPDKNSGQCSFFIGAGCTGVDHLDVSYPGTDYLGTHFNDVIGSWRCGAGQ